MNLLAAILMWVLIALLVIALAGTLALIWLVRVFSAASDKAWRPEKRK